MGHFLIPAMSPRDMEADILDYMRGRYAAEGVSALVALLDGREAERDAADAPFLPFRAWLLQLPIKSLEPRMLDRLLTDLLATLDSFETNGRGPTSGGLICT